jgi:hypothetical protein
MMHRGNGFTSTDHSLVYMLAFNGCQCKLEAFDRAKGAKFCCVCMTVLLFRIGTWMAGFAFATSRTQTASGSVTDFTVGAVMQ